MSKCSKGRALFSPCGKSGCFIHHTGTTHTRPGSNTHRCRTKPKPRKAKHASLLKEPKLASLLTYTKTATVDTITP